MTTGNSDEHQIVAVNDIVAGVETEPGDDLLRMAALDPADVGRTVGGQPAGDLAALKVTTGNWIADLEIALHPDDSGRQQAGLALDQGPDRAVIENQGSAGLDRKGEPVLAAAQTAAPGQKKGPSSSPDRIRAITPGRRPLAITVGIP